MLVLKHLLCWSYDTLEHEVRANLVYRAFARVGAGAVPNAKTILKIARVLDPAVIQQVHDRIVALAVSAQGHPWTALARRHDRRRDERPLPDRQHPVARQRTRAHPHDAARGHRAGWRGGARAQSAAECRPPGPRDRPDGPPRRRHGAATDLPAPDGDHARRPARGRHDGPTDRATGADRGAHRPAGAAAGTRGPRSLPPVGTPGVGADTRARPGRRQACQPTRSSASSSPTPSPSAKAELIKTTEFGKLVTIQEAEGQIVSAYEVHARRPADRTLWVRALDAHEQQFGRAPDLATGDRGYSSAANEAAATARGVRRVVLPRSARNRRPAAPTNANAGSAAACGGASAAKDDQRAQAPARSAALSLPRGRRRRPGRRPRRDRQQLAQHRRARRPASAGRRVTRGAR